MEIFYIQFVVDLGGENLYFVPRRVCVLARGERRADERCWFGGSLKERLRTLQFLDQIIFPTLHKHLIAI